MRAQDSPQLSKTLRERIAKVPGVTIVDRSRYYTVQKGETTLGWVTSGARRERVDFPDETDPRKVAETMYVTTAKEIPAALKRLRATKPPKPVKKGK